MEPTDVDRRRPAVFEAAFRFQALLKPDGEVLDIDRQALSFLGLSEDAVRGKRIWEIGWQVPQDDQAERLRAAVEAAGRGRMVRREAAFLNTGERPTALTFSLRPVTDDDGRVVVLVAVARNLARRREAEAALAQVWSSGEPGESRAEAAMAALPEAVLVADGQGRVEFASAAAAALLGRSAQGLQGESLEDSVGPVVDLMERCRGSAAPLELALTPPAGAVATKLLASCAALRDAAGGVVMVLRTPPEATREAARDSLTGLLNRAGLLAQLERTLATEHEQHTLCYLDLDGFQLFNEHAGHQEGDALLRQVASELRDHARTGDTLARLEGDDFALLLRDCTLQDARAVAEALVRAVHDMPLTARHEALGHLSASVGLAPPSGDARTWLRDAREACIQAKEHGGNRVAVFSGSQGRRRQDQLRALFEEGRVKLYQQPVVDLRNGGGGGHAEVLLRVMAPDGNPGSPIDLLTEAAHADLLPSLDRWIIATVFKHGAQPPATADAPGLSINLTPASLRDPDLLPFLREQRDAHGVDPARVTFEIPESAVLTDPTGSRAVMTALRDEGFGVALDDCGSALGFLRDLPADYLKIGGGLVRTMLDDPIDNVLVDSMNRVAHLGGMRTVAKSVENDALVKRLRALRLDFGQGFGLAEPMPLWPVQPNA